jgi:hypothetical protein
LTDPGQQNLSPSPRESESGADFLASLADPWFSRFGNDGNVSPGPNTGTSQWVSPRLSASQGITPAALNIDSQISQLVQAMATYSASSSGFESSNSATGTTPNDSTSLGTLAPSWHG